MNSFVLALCRTDISAHLRSFHIWPSKRIFEDRKAPNLVMDKTNAENLKITYRSKKDSWVRSRISRCTWSVYAIIVSTRQLQISCDPTRHGMEVRGQTIPQSLQSFNICESCVKLSKFMAMISLVGVCLWDTSPAYKRFVRLYITYNDTHVCQLQVRKTNGNMLHTPRKDSRLLVLVAQSSSWPPVVRTHSFVTG